MRRMGDTAGSLRAGVVCHPTPAGKILPVNANATVGTHKLFVDAEYGHSPGDEIVLPPLQNNHLGIKVQQT